MTYIVVWIKIFLLVVVNLQEKLVQPHTSISASLKTFDHRFEQFLVHAEGAFHPDRMQLWPRYSTRLGLAFGLRQCLRICGAPAELVLDPLSGRER